MCVQDKQMNFQPIVAHPLNSTHTQKYTLEGGTIQHTKDFPQVQPESSPNFHCLNETFKLLMLARQTVCVCTQEEEEEV